MTTFEFDEENWGFFFFFFFFFCFFVVLVLGFMCVGDSGECGVVCSDREILMPWVSVSQLV